MPRSAAVVAPTHRLQSLLRLSRFVVISPFLLGRFGGPSTTLAAEITAPPKTPTPVEAPAIVSDPVYGTRVEPGLTHSEDASKTKTPCNRRGSTKDWYKSVAPAGGVPLDALFESNGWGHEQKNDQGALTTDHKARGVGPLAVRTTRGVPIA